MGEAKPRRGIRSERGMGRKRKPGLRRSRRCLLGWKSGDGAMTTKDEEQNDDGYGFHCARASGRQFTA
jgi:hypothetical protein